MDGSGQLFREQRINAALACHAALAGERGGDHLDAKMTFAFRAGTGVAGVPVRLILDAQPGRLEPGGEFLANTIDHPHAAKLESSARAVKKAPQGCATVACQRLGHPPYSAPCHAPASKPAPNPPRRPRRRGSATIRAARRAVITARRVRAIGCVTSTGSASTTSAPTTRNGITMPA